LGKAIYFSRHLRLVTESRTMTSPLANSPSTVAPPMPMRAIDGPAAWRGTELRPADFTH
jgi:hypothetical protein